jgi:hypothetical protein
MLPRLLRTATMAMVLLMVALLSAVTAMRFAIHGAEVTVPQFVGVPVADAVRQAADAGLSATVDDSFYSTDIPAGEVLSQLPDPGTVVRHEWNVRLVESLGPQKVTIPNVIGQDERQAMLNIRLAHLDLGTLATTSYPGAKPGTVIAQDPPAAAHGVDRPRVSLLIASDASAEYTKPATTPAAAPAPPQNPANSAVTPPADNTKPAASPQPAATKPVATPAPPAEKPATNPPANSPAKPAAPAPAPTAPAADNPPQ